MSTAQFKVTGMHCPSCAMMVQMSLEELPGVDNAQVDKATDTATVTYSPDAIDTAAIAEAIVKAGYGAELAA